MVDANSGGRFVVDVTSSGRFTVETNNPAYIC